jgi:hypothetical protein
LVGSIYSTRERRINEEKESLFKFENYVENDVQKHNNPNQA